MSQIQSQSLSQEKFLLLSVNLLHKALVEPTRTEAKRIFRTLEEGSAVPLAAVQMEDKSTARFALSLDYSEFRGRLNFGGFRASLVALIDNISRALGEERKLSVFDSQQGDNTMVFGVTAATVEAGQTNVMVLAAGPGQSQEVTQLRLMYVDPAQFSSGKPAQQA
jgi:hypothetical protein